MVTQDMIKDNSNLNGFKDFLETYLTDPNEKDTEPINKLIYLSWIMLDYIDTLYSYYKLGEEDEFKKETADLVNEQLYIGRSLALDFPLYKDEEDEIYGTVFGECDTGFGVTYRYLTSDLYRIEVFHTLLDDKFSLAIKRNTEDDEWINLIDDADVEDDEKFAELLSAARDNVILFVKAVELGYLEFGKILQNNKAFMYDRLSIDLSDMLFVKIREFIFTKGGRDKLFSSKYNPTNSKYVHLLDKFIFESALDLPHYGMETNHDIEENVDALIQGFENISVVSGLGSKAQKCANIKVNDEVKRRIVNVITKSKNKTTMAVVSLTAENENDAIEAVFPYLACVIDNKSLVTLDEIDDENILEDVQYINDWLESTLKENDITEDNLEAGKIKMNDIAETFESQYQLMLASLGHDEICEEDASNIPTTDPRDSTKDATIEIANPSLEKITEIENCESEKLKMMLACTKEFSNKYLDLLLHQLAIDDREIRSLCEVIKIMLDENYSDLYSSSKSTDNVNFNDIFSNDSIVLNIVINGKVIDSFLFTREYDDRDNYSSDKEYAEKGISWNCTRIFDYIRTLSTYGKASFYRNCNISKSMKMGFNVSSIAGRFNLPLDRELEYIGKDSLDDEDASLMSYDIVMYALSILYNSLMHRIITGGRSYKAHMIKDTLSFRVQMEEFDVSQMFDKLEELKDDKSLSKEDFENIVKIFDKEMDPEFKGFDNSALNKHDDSLVITFFNGNVGRAGDDGVFLSNRARSSYRELCKKGSPFIATKNGEKLIIVENIGKYSRYDFNRLFRSMCNFYATK